MIVTLSVVEDLRVAFGRRIRDLRRDRELSQEELAERTGLHWTYVSGVERGQRAPSLDVVGRFANGLSVTVAELFSPLKRQYRPRFRAKAKAR